MNMASIIIISLVVGIVAGICSGLLVVRKISHDDKRSYARQPFYIDIRSRHSAIREHMLQYLYDLGCIAGEIKAQLDEDLDAKLNRILLNGLRKCLVTNYKQWTSRFDANNIVQLTNRVVQDIDDTFDFDDLSIKYPLQVSHFDKLYDVSSNIEALKSSMRLPPKPSNDLVDSTINQVIFTMLSIAQVLNRISSDLEYYRNAKPWTWRLFTPIIRN